MFIWHSVWHYLAITIVSRNLLLILQNPTQNSFLQGTLPGVTFQLIRLPPAICYLHAPMAIINESLIHLITGYKDIIDSLFSVYFVQFCTSFAHSRCSEVSEC